MAKKQQMVKGVAFKMSKAMAQGFLSARKSEDKKLTDQEYLCKCVDEQFRLLYPCVEVIVEG